MEKDDKNTMDDEYHKQRCPQTNEEQKTHGNDYTNKEIEMLWPHTQTKLTKPLLEGKVNGRRGRGRPRATWATVHTS